MTSSLERRLDKLGADLPTFEEWLGQLGQGGWTEMYSAEAKSAFEKGPPYPWREGTEETYLKKVHERLVAALNWLGDRQAVRVYPACPADSRAFAGCV
jgi:hypothetical protein